MENYILETCVDCVESALAAEKGGASRIELCSDLVIGGVSPSLPLFRQIRRYTDLKIRVLLRPRYGDYCYNDYECDELNEEIGMFREEGADGVVVGILNPDGTLNIKQLARFKESASSMEIAARFLRFLISWKESPNDVFHRFIKNTSFRSSP